MPDLQQSPQHPSPLDRYTPRTVEVPESEHPVVKAVMEGKRYVIYPYVASMLVLTFRRSMGSVRVIETGDWPMGPLFGATVIPTFFGWWGFPWGLIWSPMVLANLWRGGRDATKDILADVVGLPEAKRILSIAPKPKPPATIWLSRLVILVPVLLFGTLLVAIVTP
ncbi:MAG: hypothetical protein ABIS50_01005 [Luteolibacter sp.]|uniref:hypothetical protein n=1 Tax=Luteolibacter sp. TaxID=1962973 RepID=UPI003267F58E